MKRCSVFGIIMIITSLLLISCSSGSQNYSTYKKVSVQETAAGNYGAYEEKAMDTSIDSADTSSTNPISVEGNNTIDMDRKLIKTVNLSVETLKFDDYVEEVKNTANHLGGYLESMDIHTTGGSDYDYYSESSGTSDYKSANIIARIPSNSLEQFLAVAQTDVNILSHSENISDITLEYADTESRIAALKKEEERLFELVEKAESVDAIIAIESRLSEVFYQLESYNSQLKLYANQVQFSTVSLHIRDVHEYQNPTSYSVWEKISIGFMRNLRWVTKFVLNFMIWIISSLPTLIFFAIVIFGIVFFIQKGIKKRNIHRENTIHKSRGLFKKEMKNANTNQGQQNIQNSLSENENSKKLEDINNHHSENNSNQNTL